jgi:hypothetical protein
VERDIPAKPYRHPNESFKNFWVIFFVVMIPDLLHTEVPMNLWLAEIVGLACSLPVFALVPPRMSFGKVALLAALMCVIVAIQYFVHTLFHFHQ